MRWRLLFRTAATLNGSMAGAACFGDHIHMYGAHMHMPQVVVVHLCTNKLKVLRPPFCNIWWLPRPQRLKPSWWPKQQCFW